MEPRLSSGGIVAGLTHRWLSRVAIASRLTLAEYESVRGYATHFAIARNHENPETEEPISEHERFAVVETVSGEAVKLARRSYPRQWRRQESPTAPARSESARR
jgi:hypothetical protein